MSLPTRRLKDLILSSVLTQPPADSILESCGGQPGKAFHSWRRQTATFIGTLARPEDVGAHIDGLLDTLQSKLKHLVSDWQGSLRKRIREILLTAINLDCEVSQQCAYWFVCYPNKDQACRNRVEFDDASMKVPSTHEPGKRVALMMFPALYKAGDSHGEDYRHCEIVSKSEVICYQTSPPPKYYEPPAGASQVVDSRNVLVRKQKYERVLPQGGEASLARRFLESMGIQR